MTVNLRIDDKLLKKAVKIGGKKSRLAAVHEALEEYIRFREQARILDLAGKIDFDPTYDYKAERHRDSGARRKRKSA
jgi:hypothetical protein